MSKKSNKNNKFNALSSSIDRKANNRMERHVAEERPLMLFSFKDFQHDSQIPPGQTYIDWQEAGYLAYMLEKFGHICNVNRIEAEQNRFLKIYGAFPENSEFENPFPDRQLAWGVVMKIGGQKGRVAGHIIDNVFYVVFLDIEHSFYPSEKKNT
jgi:hypothetical protein